MSEIDRAGELERELAAMLGADCVSRDPSDLETYGRDWTRVVAPSPSFVVRPHRADDVAAIIRAARNAGVAVVPVGGRTGLAGGAVAANGELVLSLDRLAAIGTVDPAALTVTVEAGAITARVHEATAAHGLTWPVDFASKGSSTVGGNIATNAGGVRVVRYGLTRAWVLGLEVVTGAGEQLVLNGALEKNNTGIDLRQVFIGSEGILGIITRATLKLAPLPRRSDVALFGVSSFDTVLALLARARTAPFVLSAFETWTSRCASRVAKHRKLSAPFDAPHYVLVEGDGDSDATFESWALDIAGEADVLDASVAAGARARGIWELREAISESLAATGFPHKNDIAVPIAALDAFSRELEALFTARYPDVELCVFGHVGDGNLHVNVMKPDSISKEQFLAEAHARDEALFDLVRSHRGTVSAEHGIGLLKREWLTYSRTEAEIELMRAMKRVFDPDGVLNPGKVLP